jgi:hypothetical protein
VKTMAPPLVFVCPICGATCEVFVRPTSVTCARRERHPNRKPAVMVKRGDQ